MEVAGAEPRELEAVGFHARLEVGVFGEIDDARAIQPHRTQRHAPGIQRGGNGQLLRVHAQFTTAVGQTQRGAHQRQYQPAAPRIEGGVEGRLACD
ncbi:hypothetical protein D9M71_808650 [compost metagenome]